MERLPGVLFYEIAKYNGFKDIFLMETFSQVIRAKMQSNAAAFNRYLRKYENLE